jgi:hypothetical protein
MPDGSTAVLHRYVVVPPRRLAGAEISAYYGAHRLAEIVRVPHMVTVPFCPGCLPHYSEATVVARAIFAMAQSTATLDLASELAGVYASLLAMAPVAVKRTTIQGVASAIKITPDSSIDPEAVAVFLCPEDHCRCVWVEYHTTPTHLLSHEELLEIFGDDAEDEELERRDQVQATLQAPVVDKPKPGGGFGHETFTYRRALVFDSSKASKSRSKGSASKA